MKLATNVAKLKTATVDIKILTIENKQVTLAVFRQMQRERLISDGAEFIGMPWGRVNYYWGDCKPPENGGHLHVVWQKGSELRRDCIDAKRPRSEEDEAIKEWQEEAARFASVILLKRFTEYGEVPDFAKNGLVICRTWRIPWILLRPIQPQWFMNGLKYYAVTDFLQRSSLGGDIEQLEASMDEAGGKLKDQQEALRELDKKYSTLYENLNVQIDQLFIAV